MNKTRMVRFAIGTALAVLVGCGGPVETALGQSEASLSAHDPKLDEVQASPPIHIHKDATTSPTGLTPAKIRAAYNLPATGGVGTVAIIDAYDNPNAEKDLGTYSAAQGLPSCTTANGCFEKHLMAGKIRSDSGWGLEIALDVQVAHTVAPNAKILLVEAKSSSGTDLLAAVDYARNRADVVAVSMSWGGGEFSSEAASDPHFTSAYGATFFAASGDNGAGAEWPAVSPNVVAVGGTTLAFNPDGTLASETVWSGSGGGASTYEALPGYQAVYGLTGKRQTPDVSANADPASGYSVYDSYGCSRGRCWYQVGGTSGSTPLWAGIRALGASAGNDQYYSDAIVNAPAYFRDITSGSNGFPAGPGYDLATGLGSPLTTSF